MLGWLLFVFELIEAFGAESVRLLFKVQFFNSFPEAKILFSPPQAFGADCVISAQKGHGMQFPKVLFPLHNLYIDADC